MEALKKFVKIISSDIILKIVENKVFSLLWCFTQTSNFLKILLRKVCTDLIFTCDQLNMMCGI